MATIMREDFTHFFENRQFYAWDSSVANRSMAWEAWFESRVTFWEALWLMLPSCAHPRSLAERFRVYKKISAHRLCVVYLESDGSLYLLGKRFIVPDGDYESLIHHIRKTIAEHKKNDPAPLVSAETILTLEKGNFIIPYYGKK